MVVVWIVYSGDVYEGIAFEKYYTTSFDTLDLERRGPIQCKSVRKINYHSESTAVFVASQACIDTVIAYCPQQQLKDYVSLNRSLLALYRCC